MTWFLRDSKDADQIFYFYIYINGYFEPKLMFFYMLEMGCPRVLYVPKSRSWGDWDP